MEASRFLKRAVTVGGFLNGVFMERLLERGRRFSEGAGAVDRFGEGIRVHSSRVGGAVKVDFHEIPSTLT